MNKVLLIGRLTKDVDLSYTQGGKAVAKFALAVDRPYSNGEKQTDFINIVVWDKIAENAAKYLGKGRQAAIEGRLQIRSYDAKDGRRVWISEVIAERVEFLGGKGDSKGGNEQEPLGYEVEFDDNELPF